VVLSPSMPLTEAINRIDAAPSAANGLPTLVRDGPEVAGWTNYCSVRDAQKMGEELVTSAMTQLRPDQMISATTTTWRLIQLFAEGRQDFFFVLDGAEIVGTLEYRDLFKPLFRIALFALVSQLEQESLKLCIKHSEQCWSNLSNKKREQASRMYRRAHNKAWRRDPERGWELEESFGGKAGDAESNEVRDFLRSQEERVADSPWVLIEYTVLEDKSEMLMGARLVPNWAESVFANAQKIRNRCCHPDAGDDVLEPNPQQLWNTVSDCHRLITAMANATHEGSGNDDEASARNE
jgi:hypothetical protein